MAFTREEFLAISRPIIKKAAEDDDFRCKCLSEPESISSEDIEDLKIPEGMKLTFVEDLEAASRLPEPDEVVVELAEENYCKFKHLENGVSRTYTFEVEEADGDYDLTDCAEVQD